MKEVICVVDDVGIYHKKEELIRCKDCAKREYCRTSNTWAVAPNDDWFCADAERREE